MSPLAVAVAAGQVDLVGVLVAHTPSKLFTSAAYVKLLRTLPEKPSAITLEKASKAFQETHDSRAAWCDLLANASVAGDLNMVKLAIGKGAVPTARTTKGENPLHHAILLEHVGIVDALLAAGGDIEAVDDQGRNALHLAASKIEDTTLSVIHGNRKKEQIATSILQQKRAKVNGRTPAGDTALHFAVRTGDDALVAALLRHSASVDIRNRRGRTPLHYAVDAWLFPHIIEMLLQQGANPTAADLQGYTPAHLIRDRNCAQVIDLLLCHGADASAPTRSGDHPVHSAVRRQNWNAVRCLLNAGASVHDRGARRRTLLHVAARRGHASLIEELMKMGADIEALDADGWTPMRHAKEKGRVEVIVILSRFA
jgi:ankyrin repeat protein